MKWLFKDVCDNTAHIYIVNVSGKYTEITKVNLSAVVYRLFLEDLSSMDVTSMKQSVDKSR